MCYCSAHQNPQMLHRRDLFSWEGIKFRIRRIWLENASVNTGQILSRTAFKSRGGTTSPCLQPLRQAVQQWRLTCFSTTNNISVNPWEAAPHNTHSQGQEGHVGSLIKGEGLLVSSYGFHIITKTDKRHLLESPAHSRRSRYLFIEEYTLKAAVPPQPFPPGC